MARDLRRNESADGLYHALLGFGVYWTQDAANLLERYLRCWPLLCGSANTPFDMGAYTNLVSSTLLRIGKLNVPPHKCLERDIVVTPSRRSQLHQWFNRTGGRDYSGVGGYFMPQRSGASLATLELNSITGTPLELVFHILVKCFEDVTGLKCARQPYPNIQKEDAHGGYNGERKLLQQLFLVVLSPLLNHYLQKAYRG